MTHASRNSRRKPRTWAEVPAHLRARILSTMHLATAAETRAIDNGPPVSFGEFVNAQDLAAKELRRAARIERAGRGAKR